MSIIVDSPDLGNMTILSQEIIKTSLVSATYCLLGNIVSTMFLAFFTTPVNKTGTIGGYAA